MKINRYYDLYLVKMDITVSRNYEFYLVIMNYWPYGLP